MNNNKKTGKAIVWMSIILVTVIGVVFVLKNHEGFESLFNNVFVDGVQTDEISEPNNNVLPLTEINVGQEKKTLELKVIYEPVMPKNFELPESTYFSNATETTDTSSVKNKTSSTEAYTKTVTQGAKKTKTSSKGSEKTAAHKTSNSAENALSVKNAYSRNDGLPSFRRMSDSDWSKLEQIIETITSYKMNRVEQIKAVHDYMIKNIYYDLTYTQHDASDTLNHGIAVCSGYSALFANAMDVLGIPNCELVGNSRNSDGEEGLHAWNAVMLEDEKWYVLDITWDDPLMDDTSDYKNGENLRYDYFLVASRNIMDSHMPESVPSPLAKDDCPWWEYIGKLVDDSEDDNISIIETDIDPVVVPGPDSEEVIIPMPDPVVIVPIPDPIVVVPEPDPIIIVPEPDPVIIVPEPDPVIIVPEPDPVIIVPEPDPVIITPEPDPVIIVPEPDPVIIVPEPDPVIIVPEPDPVIIIPEPDPVIITPEPEPIVNPIIDTEPFDEPSPSESGFHPKDPSLGIDFGRNDSDGPGEFTAGVLIDGVWYSEKDSIVYEHLSESSSACGYFELPDDID